MVIRYAYLWRSEHEKGIEEGSKDRPCAVLLAVTDESGDRKVVVLPITHTPPRDLAVAIEIPAVTKRRLGLDDERSWIVVEESNRFTWPGPDLRPMKSGDASTVVYGELPADLFRKSRFVRGRATNGEPMSLIENTHPDLFPHLEYGERPTLSGDVPRVRARKREAEWHSQLARAYVYAANRTRSADDQAALDAEYEAELARGPDFARYRGKSEFLDAPKISIDRNAAARIKFMIVCIQRGSWKVKDKGKHGGLIPRTVIPVFDALVRLAFKHGRVFPSLVGLAQLAMCCKQTVVQALKVLEFYGFIRVHRRIKRIRTPLGFKTVQDTNAYEVTEPNGWGQKAMALFGGKFHSQHFHNGHVGRFKASMGDHLATECAYGAQAPFAFTTKPITSRSRGDFGFAFVMLGWRRDEGRQYPRALRGKERLHMFTVAITINKGGVGKTTITKSLATKAAVEGFSVLILDMDTQQNSDSWGKRRAKFWPDKVLPLVQFVTEKDLPEALERARAAECDLVLIDTPPGRSTEAPAAVEVSNLVLIPFNVDTDAFEGLAKTAALARRLGVPVAGVLNLAQPNSRSEEDTAREVLASYGVPLCPAILHRYTAHKNASLAGLTANEAEPGSTPGQEIANLWAWLWGSMTKPNKAAVFLNAMSAAKPAASEPVAVANDPAPQPKARSASRDGLKHIGGYFSRDDVEKFAILRARLDLDNSQLIRLAVDDLYRKHEAKRAFEPQGILNEVRAHLCIPLAESRTPRYLGTADLAKRWSYTTRGVRNLIQNETDFPAPAFTVNEGRIRVWAMEAVEAWEVTHPEVRSPDAKRQKTLYPATRIDGIRWLCKPCDVLRKFSEFPPTLTPPVAGGLGKGAARCIPCAALRLILIDPFFPCEEARVRPSRKRAAPWRGRPRVEHPLSHILRVRFSARQLEDLHDAANKAGLSVADFLRVQALNGKKLRPVRRPPVEVQEIARLYGAIGKVGGNVNQLAHHANALHALPAVTELRAIRSQLA
eukprot:gene18683-18982_t